MNKKKSKIISLKEFRSVSSQGLFEQIEKLASQLEDTNNDKRASVKAGYWVGLEQEGTKLLVFADNGYDVSESVEVSVIEEKKIAEMLGRNQMVRKYLDASTRHLTEETINVLQSNKDWSITAYSYEEGVFIVVPEKESIKDIPEDLEILLKYAWENDISLICLDRDAEELYGILPVYIW